MYNVELRRVKLPLRMSVTFYVNTKELAAVGVERLHGYAQKVPDRHAMVRYAEDLRRQRDREPEGGDARALRVYRGHGFALLHPGRARQNGYRCGRSSGTGRQIHTIGDAAARAALQAAGDVRAAGFDTRYSTTHSQLVHPDDRPLYVEHDVTAQTTGNWAVLSAILRGAPQCRSHPGAPVPLRLVGTQRRQPRHGRGLARESGRLRNSRQSVLQHLFGDNADALARASRPNSAALEGSVLPPEERSHESRNGRCFRTPSVARSCSVSTTR